MTGSGIDVDRGVETTDSRTTGFGGDRNKKGFLGGPVIAVERGNVRFSTATVTAVAGADLSRAWIFAGDVECPGVGALVSLRGHKAITTIPIAAQANRIGFGCHNCEVINRFGRSPAR